MGNLFRTFLHTPGELYFRVFPFLGSLCLSERTNSLNFKSYFLFLSRTERLFVQDTRLMPKKRKILFLPPGQRGAYSIEDVEHASLQLRTASIKESSKSNYMSKINSLLRNSCAPTLAGFDYYLS